MDVDYINLYSGPIRWKMNGLEEWRGLLATIWLFHILMDGAPQDGVSADTHIHCTSIHYCLGKRHA